MPIGSSEPPVITGNQPGQCKNVKSPVDASRVPGRSISLGSRHSDGPNYAFPLMKIFCQDYPSGLCPRGLKIVEDAMTNCQYGIPFDGLDTSLREILLLWVGAEEVGTPISDLH